MKFAGFSKGQAKGLEKKLSSDAPSNGHEKIAAALAPEQEAPEVVDVAPPAALEAAPQEDVIEFRDPEVLDEELLVEDVVTTDEPFERIDTIEPETNPDVDAYQMSDAYVNEDPNVFYFT